MEGLTYSYRNKTKEIWKGLSFPTKFVEYSDEKTPRIYPLLPQPALLYARHLLYAVRHTFHSPAGVTYPLFYCCHHTKRNF